MPVILTESVAFAEAATPAAGSGRLLIRLIDAGKGSSGVYPAEVLKAAAESKVFAAGTHMFIDHPGENESYDRPERTLKDLAAVLVEDARWDKEAKALVAEARVYSRWAPALAEMADDIGVSIRAYAESTTGEWNGQPAKVITELTEAISVDFVTRAGRGGKVLAVIESARRVEEARNVGQWVESRIHAGFTEIADDMFGNGRLTRAERITLSNGIGAALDAFTAVLEEKAPQLYERDLWDTPPADTGTAEEATGEVTEAPTNDRRDQLNALLREEHGGDKTWVWVADFDDETTTVWFQIDTPDESSTWSQQYTVTDDVATVLTGDRTEVRRTTIFVPVEAAAPAEDPTPAAEQAAPTNVPGHPAGQTTQESEEDTMPQIEEARLRQLEEDAGRVHALESERDTAVKERDEAKSARLQAEAGTYARDFARKLVTKANGDLAEASVARIVGDAIRGDLPLTEAGRLDTDAFTPVVEKARTEEETYLAQVAEASGIGSVRGVGAPVEEADKDLSDDELDESLAKLSGRTTVKGA
ncbi:hypothetical protein [Cellulomonas rhizosphaerae]|uniref:Uncharacterized protein n=1 Tax=Cellulomonas rhizosphaerae TaxID=2293719 RepID=A0A413RJK3_9CELL|nr:hypothetical protein [Cellulomonas rhizosphaerae]RHA38732.1 hypothetical protein D1825_13445 [Cellulomonas rhizosphaerae]